MNITPTTHLTPQMVSASARNVADRDGDGRTGVAALNDGDAASRAARLQAQSTASASAAPTGRTGRSVDVRA